MRFLIAIVSAWMATVVLGELMLQGIEIGKRLKRIEGDLPSKTLDTFKLCFFIKINEIGKGSRDTKLLVLADNHTTINLKYMNNVFSLKEVVVQDKKTTKNQIDHYLTSIDLQKWMKICLWRKDKEGVNFELNYRTPKKRGWDHVFRYLLMRKNLIDAGIDSRRKGEAPTIEFGEFLPKLKYEIAALSYSIDFTPTNQSKDEFSCINRDEILMGENFTNIWTKEPRNVLVYSNIDICRDTFVLVPIPDHASYSMHAQRCRTLKGRMIYGKEIEIFGNEEFRQIENDEETHDGETPYVETWLAGGMEYAQSLSYKCPHNFDSNDTFVEGKRPCVIETDNNLCIVPALSDFTLYGDLLKYDRSYYLKQSGNPFKIEGKESSFVEKDKSSKQWLLKSIIHRDEYVLRMGSLPFGRNKWISRKDSSIMDLTITPCNISEFACSTGECLPQSKHCDGVMDCNDQSDEIECKLIKKSIGYIPDNVPPPRSNETDFQLNYDIHVYNIADITNEEGVALVDLSLLLYWSDPRLVFWNPLEFSKFDCNEIWNPEIIMADGFPSGFQIKYEAYRSHCQVYTVGRQKYSFTDSYMGTYVDKDEMKIAYVFSGLVTVPCRFYLRRYPFGSQTCNISIWPDNALLTTGYKLSYFNLTNGRNTTINYKGRRVLGEYMFVEANHIVIDERKRVMLSIQLRSLAEFHMLNSFIPSILIWIITYATLYFPVDNFNERVMVSITALLVLAALFTQASDLSFITPYFKFLDIWYVALIIFSFLVVIVNAFIHKVRSKIEEKSKVKENKAVNKPDEDMGGDQIVDERVRKLMKNNAIARTLIGCLFGAFFILYGLGALEIV